MRLTRPVLFWIVAVAALTSAAALLRQILLPFFLGLVLAYLLNPLVSRLERAGVNRSLAALALIVSIGVAIALTFILAAPLIAGEATYFVESFPRYLHMIQEISTSADRPWLSKIVGEGFGHAQRAVNELVGVAGDSLGDFLTSLWSGGRALFAMFSVVVVAPFIAFYLLCDWNAIIADIQSWIPEPHRKLSRELAREIDQTISGFIQGQGMLCLILAAYYATALYAIGLHHAIILGMIAGLISFAPYLGSLTGIGVGTCVAIAQFWPSVHMIVAVPVIFVVGELVADYVLAPYLVGRKIHLSPAWVLFALFAFGYLFGFFGLLVAEPLAAAIGVVIRFISKAYAESAMEPKPRAPMITSPPPNPSPPVPAPGRD